MNFIKIAVKRPVTTTMIILIAVVYGILSFLNLNLDMLPNINVPVAAVMTSYEGAGSEEIENLITKPLEGALGTITGVDEVQSMSSYGNSTIIIVFDEDVDMDVAGLDIRERVDLVKDFLPDDANEPIIMKIDVTQVSSILIGVKSDTKGVTELQTIVDDKIINRIERLPGVASISTTGGREMEVSVQFDEQKMIGYGINEQTVLGVLAGENFSIPVGSVKQGNISLPIKVKGELDSLVDIENVVIPTQNSRVFLGDIATVDFKYKEQNSKNFMDSQEALILNVSKQSTANSVNVSDEINAEIAKINSEMNDLELVMLMDPAEYIKISLGNVSNSAIIGGFLAILVLLIFLNDIRAALVVGVAMPVSIVVTFLFMHLAGLSLNMMSLGGLALGVGMLVDNSIVVIESIYRKLEQGYSKINASILGAKEVAVPVTASTLTTVAVFLPITFAGGMAADIFNELSFTITFSLLSSLISALTFVPMASSLFLETVEEKSLANRKTGRLIQKFQSTFIKLEEKYKSLLEYSIHHRKNVIATVLIFILATGIISGVALKTTMIPSMDESMVIVNITLPRGTVIEDTEEKAKEVFEYIGELPEVENTSLMIGSDINPFQLGSSSNSATIYLFLSDVLDRDRTSFEIANELNKKVKMISGAKVSATAETSAMGGFGSPVTQIQIFGTDLDVLEEIVDDFVEIAEEIPDAGLVSTSLQVSSPQAEITVDKEKAMALGINTQSIPSTIRTALQGSVATTYKTKGTEYDIRISQNTDNFNFIVDLEKISIPTAMGTNIPLTEIAKIEVVDTPMTINRTNQQRYETVTIATGDSDIGSIKSYIDKHIKDYIMPEGYYWQYTGTSQEMVEMFTSLAQALVAAILIVYMIMAAQFESYKYPFIVMFSLPIAMTGGLFGLIITGELFSITSFMGLIMLSGIVINNAIVLIDYINVLVREENYTINDAILKAGPIRLRPILMTTLTTVLGLLPILISGDAGAEMMRGLAVVVVFGLSFSTLVTLIFIPTIYIVVNNSTEKTLKKKYEKKAKKLGITYEEYLTVVENSKTDKITNDSLIDTHTKEFK